jgi:NAD(P)-dependent dehydrogenase (short-subunit alcohol dehydrogenase family)
MVMAQFDKKVAFITGGNSGIGRAAALAFTREGAKVAVVARRPEPGEQVVAEIRDAGGEATFIAADVTDEPEVAQAVRSTIDAFGRLDIAFNSAGTWHPMPFAHVTTELWRDELEVNLTSVFLSMKHELPVMERQGRGVIVNTASILGVVGVGGGLAPYVAAKHGVVGLGRAAALEYARSDIRINTIAPGGVDTPHYRATFGAADETHRQFQEMHPVGRLATPDEIASLVLYLSSDAAAFINGAALAADGGWSAQ